MKKYFLVMMTLAAVLITAVPAMAVNYEYSTEAVKIYSTLSKYDPYPAEPDKYATVWFMIENQGTKDAYNLTFMLDTEYPFSLDASEKPDRFFPILWSYVPVLLEYKVRVDKDAIEGDNEIGLRYQVGSTWTKKEFTITIDRTPSNAEIEPILAESDLLYPGGKGNLSIDIANIAPGAAYYTLVEIITPAADVVPEKIFVGTLDANDFDTLDIELKVKNVTPGRYPINLLIRYKNEDYKEVEEEKTVWFAVVSKKEATEVTRQETPLWQYALYAIVIILLLRYLLWKWIQKAYELIRKRKK